MSGAISLTPRSEQAAALVQTIVDDLRSAYPSSTIELVCDISADVEVAWDVERVTQVITNLVNNSIAHGAVAFPVRVAAWTEPDAVVISVQNYGPPIARELLPSIFDPFKHGAEKPRHRAARGLGLGLFIVDQIVRAHGGDINVSSDDLTGTTFTLRMPRACVVDRAELQARQKAAATEPPLVMVVDDDEDIRIGMTGILEKRGFRVACASDGLEALKLLEEGLHPQLILLDISMPRMNGEELCERLAASATTASIPVVVISADTAAALRVSRSNAKAFLAKPVSLDQLLSAIETIR